MVYIVHHKGSAISSMQQSVGDSANVGTGGNSVTDQDAGSSENFDKGGPKSDSTYKYYEGSDTHADYKKAQQTVKNSKKSSFKNSRNSFSVQPEASNAHDYKNTGGRSKSKGEYFFPGRWHDGALINEKKHFLEDEELQPTHHISDVVVEMHDMDALNRSLTTPVRKSGKLLLVFKFLTLFQSKP